MTITDADRGLRGESCVTGVSPDAEQDCEIRITWHVPAGDAHPAETFEYRRDLGDALNRAHEILQEHCVNPWCPEAHKGVAVEAVHVRRPGEGWYRVTASR